MNNKAIRNDILLTILTVPLYMAGIGRYGFKLVILLLLCILTGFFTEYVSNKILKKDNKLYSFSAWFLLPLILPPAFPIWMTLVSLVFGLLITVVFFGGHGRQLASPVAVAWAFALLSFSTAYNFGWVYPFEAAFGGLDSFSAMVPIIDHPVQLFAFRQNDFLIPILNGAFPQIPGNTLPILTICLGLLLLFLKAVDYRTAIGFIASYIILYLSAGALFPDIGNRMTGLIIGNIWMLAFFILPDMRTAARTFTGRWITGLLTGIIAFLINIFSAFPDGMLFAVIFANVMCALIDEGVLNFKYREKHERS